MTTFNYLFIISILSCLELIDKYNSKTYNLIRKFYCHIFSTLSTGIIVVFNLFKFLKGYIYNIKTVESGDNIKIGDFVTVTKSSLLIFAKTYK